MRRFIMVLAVSALMVAQMVAMALPAAARRIPLLRRWVNKPGERTCLRRS
jgi:hypothetical protein